MNAYITFNDYTLDHEEMNFHDDLPSHMKREFLQYCFDTYENKKVTSSTFLNDIDLQIETHNNTCLNNVDFINCDCHLVFLNELDYLNKIRSTIERAFERHKKAIDIIILAADIKKATSEIEKLVKNFTIHHNYTLSFCEEKVHDNLSENEIRSDFVTYCHRSYNNERDLLTKLLLNLDAK